MVRTLIWKERAKVGALLMVCVTLGVLAAQLTFQPRLLSGALAPVLNETTGTLRDIHESVSTSKELITAIKQDYEQNQENMAANSEAATVVLNQTSQAILDFRAHVFGGELCQKTGTKKANGWAELNCTTLPGILPQASLLLSDANGWIIQLKADTHDLESGLTDLLKSVDSDVLNPLRADLEKLGGLEDTLAQELRTNSEHAQATLQEINGIVAKVDGLLADEENGIAAIVKNTAKTTRHAGELAETADIATRDLRKKASRVVFVLKTIGNYLKATVGIR